MRLIPCLALALASLRISAARAAPALAVPQPRNDSPRRAAVFRGGSRPPPKARRAMAAAAALAASTALAMPGAMQLGGHKLAAASCGVRSTLWVEHYTVVLYLPGKGAAAEALIDPASSKALRLRIINKMLMPAEIPPKWREPMKENLHAADFARATDIYRDLQPGDRLTLAYAPDTGVAVTVNGRHMATAKGHGLVDALLETWADGKPLREKLSRAIERHPCDREAVAGADRGTPSAMQSGVDTARPPSWKPG